MNIVSELSATSAICPDVTFRVRRLSLPQRTAIDIQTLVLRQRQREIQLDYPAFTDQERELREQLGLAYRKLGALPAANSAPALAEIEEIQKAIRAATPAGAEKKRALFDLEFELLAAEMKPYFVRAALTAIDGLTVDGVPVAPTEFVDRAPAELVSEVFDAIEAHMRLSANEAKNSSSPSTSGAVGGEPTIATSAPSAGVPPILTTSPATA